jgi:hypothetical protein
MLKKILIFGVITLFIGLLVFSYSFLKAERNKLKQPLEAIPVSASIVIESMHVRETWAHISATNLVYSQLTLNNKVAQLDRHLHYVDSLIQIDSSLVPLVKNNPIAISFHSAQQKEVTTGFNYFMAISATNSLYKTVQSLIEKETLSKPTEKSHNGYSYIHFELDETSLFYAFASPLILITDSEKLLKESFDQLLSNESLLQKYDFLQVRQNYSPSVSLRTYFNIENCETTFTNWLNDSGMILWSSLKNNMPKWVSFDLTTKADALIFSGYSWSKIANTNFTHVEDIPTYQNCLPNQVSFLKSNTIKNIKNYLTSCDSNLVAQLSVNCNCDIVESINNWFGSETLKVVFKTEKDPSTEAYFLSAVDEVNLIGQLTQFGVDDKSPTKIGGHYAFKLTSLTLLHVMGYSEIDSSKCNYFAQIGDYAVFSSLDGLKMIEATFQSNLTTINENNFLTFQTKLISQYSQKTTFYLIPMLIADIKSVVKEEYQAVLDQLNADFSSLQSLGFQTNGINEQLNYISLVVNSNPGGQKKETTTEVKQDELLWSIIMKNEIIRAPDLIKNHQTNTYEIVVQDVENSIHLISPTGKVKWSKPLNEPIIGTIKQIDIYNNGKLQLVFNTSSKIYCIDINGNNVTGYPIKLPANASNSVAIMDYENKHDYRYLIATVDNKILNYDKAGLPVKGWSSKGSKSLIINPIEHFVTAGKDYLFASDINGAVYLLDRKGAVRQTVSGSFKAANKEMVFLQKGHSLENSKIIYLNVANQLEEFSLTGKIQKLTQDTTAMSTFWAIDIDGDNKKEWVVSTQTKMVVYNGDKKVVYAENFSFPVFNSIRVVGVQKKYVIVEDIQNNKLIIYNNKFEKLTTFKSKASKSAAIGDLNNDDKDDLVTIINGKEIISYTLSTLYGI